MTDVTDLTDPLVERIIARMRQRSDEGMKSYGIALEDCTYGQQDWIKDAQEEAWDKILYLEKVRGYLAHLQSRNYELAMTVKLQEERIMSLQAEVKRKEVMP